LKRNERSFFRIQRSSDGFFPRGFPHAAPVDFLGDHGGLQPSVCSLPPVRRSGSGERDDDLPDGGGQGHDPDIAKNYKPILVLSGGEPLYRPDILDLAGFARDQGLRVALATNGTLVTAEESESH
jgi:hypothetical protein